MADPNASLMSSNPVNSGLPRNEVTPRDRLARLVVVGSFLTIFMLVAALLSVAQLGSKDAADLAEKTFNTILPVLAGWVGSVLAFYFSAQSQEATNQRLTQAINLVGGTTPSPAGPTVAETMLPLEAIRGLQKLDGKAPASIPLADLRAIFNSPAQGGPISRLIFTDGGKFRYVLHVGILDAYMVEFPVASNPQTQTFGDLLKAHDYEFQVSKLVAYIGMTATLAQAKTALDAVPRAHDIIVTSTGDANGQMVGWITNVDLIKALSVT